MRLIFLFLFFSHCIFSQTKKDLNDFSFTLHEETVNKVLTAIGEISGTNDYEVMFIKGKYHWKIINPEIQIRPDSSHFVCDALVNVGPFKYKTNVKGDVKITYDKLKDKIVIKITRAIFELYTVILDKKFHITDIHLEDKFKEPFLFDGPKAYSTTMDVSLPDSAIKIIYIQPSDCDVQVRWQEVCATCEVAISDKPFKKSIATQKPKVAATYSDNGVPTGTVTKGVSTQTKTVISTESKTVTPQKK
jgi:hypothetical protein